MINKNKVCLERYVYEDKQTTGKLFIYDEKGNLDLVLDTLELAWKDNQRRISCIPEGTYKVIEHISQKFGNCFWIQNVPNRSEVLIHQGNYHTDILGCILVGLSSKDINNDGYKDVISSKKAMNRLLNSLPNDFELIIEDCRK
tara:strand:- start:76 stop:504 length:429 start_codon:yes stop_codon:yes gene_type:complete